jgi:hypothetical protein
MYWQSMRIGSRRRSVGRGIFTSTRSLQKKVWANVATLPLAAALEPAGEREEALIIRRPDAAEISAQWSRDRQISDISNGGSLGPIASDAHARHWTRILGHYRTPNHLRGAVELAVTAFPLLTLWIAAWFTFSLGYAWASLLIAVPAAGFLVRLFMIQHDCGHGAFFKSRLANDWVGRVIGVLTLTPYDWWAPYACGPSCNDR